MSGGRALHWSGPPRLETGESSGESVTGGGRGWEVRVGEGTVSVSKGGRQTDRHHLTNNSVGRVADAELAVCDSMV